jgi:uncharacterized membrane protein
MHHKKTFSDVLNTLWILFLGGLFAILPLALTVYFISFAFRMVLRALSPLVPFIPNFLRIIPHVEILLAIGTIILLGLIMRVFILRAVIHAFEDLLFRLPLIRPIYSGIKQLVSAFDQQNKLSFKKVVLIEFPRKDLFSIGFMTSEEPMITPGDDKKYYNIFIPTTPNPTTGFFIILAEDQMKIIDISRQDAMALIISGGIIQPQEKK